MLIGIIKNETHKEDYLINIEENENDRKVNITRISEKGIKSLTKNEAHSLIKILLSGKLRYLEDYNEYKVYNLSFSSSVIYGDAYINSFA